MTRGSEAMPDTTITEAMPEPTYGGDAMTTATEAMR